MLSLPRLRRAPLLTRSRLRRAQERLLKKAEAEKDGKPSESKKPIVVKFGINHITYLVEQARARALLARMPRLLTATVR